MKRALRRWLALPSLSELECENRALRRRVHILRDALEQTAWRTRMNIRLPDNAAAYHLATDTLVRDMKIELAGSKCHLEPVQ